ncbi:family 43 glycosylhydrolase [uncultured Lactobacillus sp.]|uniref:family 43 glycosylhydrolase n=1 Tax=uncultured Lactobacillus sp. TaxID=153152 RepID=UPI002805BF31|nr:family 43 glycosylhydrolase [uncultured Lactobacillus sp.]
MKERTALDLLISEINTDSKIKSIVDKHFPGLVDMSAQSAISVRMSLNDVLKMAPKLTENKENVEKLKEELMPYSSKDYLNKLYERKINQYQKIEKEREAKAIEKSKKPKKNLYHSFRPGKEWSDTQGEPIQAHAGAIIKVGNTYYLYGENKEFTDTNTPIWTWGVRMYSSKDLYNWNDEGLIINPVLNDPNSSLFPEKCIDRPHIVKNSKGKYICWLKLTGSSACFVVLEANNIKGPYKIIRDNYRPFDIKVGDYDIVVDKNNNGWLFVTQESAGVFTLKLNSDLTLAEQKVTKQYENLKGFMCREGIAVFEHNGKKYMFSSGMTNYVPNQGDCAVSEKWNKPFKSIGDPYIDDETLTSFNSQFSKVFHIPDTDKYIVLADRWLGEKLLNRSDAELIRKVLTSLYDKDICVTGSERNQVINGPISQPTPTKYGRYVWLPLIFDSEGNPKIKWYSEWSLNDDLKAGR